MRDLSPAVDGRVLKITFTADVNDEMPWKFKPQQQSVKVVPGETALAFYKATNPTNLHEMFQPMGPSSNSPPSECSAGIPKLNFHMFLK